MKRLYLILIAILIFFIALFIYKNQSDYTWSELILNTFSRIKRSSKNNVDIHDIMTKQSGQPVSHEAWTELLQRHVSIDGQVDYRAFQSDSAALNDYLDLLSNQTPGVDWSQSEKLAYWINTYNAYTVKLICNHYPVESIKDLGGKLPMINSAWDLKFFKIAGVPFDLNTIEHEILRKQYDEPLIHFALNCASFSCPKLLNEAYISDLLSDQLYSQAVYFINNAQKNKITEKESQISKIFDWYQSDFTKNGSISEFLKQYAPQIDGRNRIQYLNYDWSLNDVNN